MYALYATRIVALCTEHVNSSLASSRYVTSFLLDCYVHLLCYHLNRFLYWIYICKLHLNDLYVIEVRFPNIFILHLKILGSFLFFPSLWRRRGKSSVNSWMIIIQKIQNLRPTVYDISSGFWNKSHELSYLYLIIQKLHYYKDFTFIFQNN